MKNIFESHYVRCDDGNGGTGLLMVESVTNDSLRLEKVSASVKKNEPTIIFKRRINAAGAAKILSARDDDMLYGTYPYKDKHAIVKSDKRTNQFVEYY